MNIALPELLFAGVLVIMLIGVAAYYGWRGGQTLRGLRAQEDLTPDDRRFYRNQSWRRLAGSALMLLMAGSLAVSYLGGQERQAEAAVEAQPPAVAGPNDPGPTPEQVRFLLQYGTFWIAFSVVFLILVGLALVDLWATHRFGRRHYRQIQDDRRAMIERQVARLRSQRNGR